MTLVVWDRFHRGDRVRLVDGLGSVGIVEGWKDERVLVFWGVNGGPCRLWHDRFDLCLADVPLVEIDVR